MDTYEQAEAYLFGRINFERAHAAGATSGDFKLDRMRDLLRRLGDPHTQLPAVHIAGTKGKGSTAAMCAAILRQAGYCVGLFTSPHVSRFEERMTVDGEQPSAAQVVQLVARLRAVTAAMDAECPHGPPTFFEVVTAMAWLHFLAERVDIVVLEVGLGGRLDSTNLCRPEVCAITTISRDHTNLLGPTLAHIAGEKAGIIKPGVPVLSGAESQEAHAVIREVARRNDAPLLELRHDIRWKILEDREGHGDSPRIVAVETPWRRHAAIGVPLAGAHQAANAAMAAALADALHARGWRIPDEAVSAGIAGVSWPLRIEVIRRDPTVILDAAHNWASVQALLRTLDAEFRARRRVLVFSGTKDKDVAGLLRQFLPCFDAIVLTQYQNNPRCVPADQLAGLVRTLCDFPFHVAPSPADAWGLAQRLAGPDDLICVAGSFFLAAEMRDVIRGWPAGWPAMEGSVASSPSAPALQRAT